MAIYPRLFIKDVNNWRSGMNALLNLIKEQGSDNLIDKIYFYAKDLSGPKCRNVGIKDLNDLKAFIEYSQYMDDVYNNIDVYNPNRKKKNFNWV